PSSGARARSRRRPRKAGAPVTKRRPCGGIRRAAGTSPPLRFYAYSSAMPAKPALRTELLFYLSFLAAAALLVGVATMLVATSFAPERTFVLVMLLVALEVAVFLVFGRYLVNRLVLWPLERVVATADAVADGDLGRRRGADPEVATGVTRELERPDRIVRGLLDYARPQEEALAPLDAGAAARGAYGLLEAQGALKPVRASLEVAPDVPRMLGRAHL